MLSALQDVTPVINNSIFSPPPAVKPIRTRKNIFSVNKTIAGSTSTIAKSHILSVLVDEATDYHCCCTSTDLGLHSPHYLECRILSFHHYQPFKSNIANNSGKEGRCKLYTKQDDQLRQIFSSALNMLNTCVFTSTFRKYIFRSSLN